MCGILKAHKVPCAHNFKRLRPANSKANNFVRFSPLVTIPAKQVLVQRRNRLWRESSLKSFIGKKNSDRRETQAQTQTNRTSQISVSSSLVKSFISSQHQGKLVVESRVRRVRVSKLHTVYVIRHTIACLGFDAFMLRKSQ